jgi:hypothetical protein
MYDTYETLFTQQGLELPYWLFLDNLYDFNFYLCNDEDDCNYPSQSTYFEDLCDDEEDII